MKISTHAPRTGSDLGYGYYKRMPQAISTHAPRTGSDKAQRCAPCRRCYFNPRSPHGERRGGMTDDGQRGAISTHAPRTGSDLTPYVCGPRELISTHAPRTGSDGLLHLHTLKSNQNFNPRSPHGERPAIAGSAADGGNFNPRSPHGERPRSSTNFCVRGRFQPTLPARGATSSTRSSTTNAPISTHAPRTGSDSFRVLHRHMQTAFQPTLPARGATMART